MANVIISEQQKQEYLDSYIDGINELEPLMKNPFKYAKAMEKHLKDLHTKIYNDGIKQGKRVAFNTSKQ